MNFSFNIILPELILILTAFLILISDLFLASKNKISSWPLMISLLGIFSAAIAAAFLVNEPVEIMNGRLGLNNLGLVFKEILLLAAGLVVMLSSSAIGAKAKIKISKLPEFFTILLLTLSGMLFLVSSRDLITLYVSLELATIPLFALTAWAKSEVSGEAGFKYLVMGALGSALLLYGFGFLYSLSGDMSLAALQNIIKTDSSNLPIIYISAALIISGIGFKLTLFPFHMWAPDAYQGAPTPVTAFLSVASKTTGLILALQLLTKVFGSFLIQWTPGLALLAALTMSMGNLVAIRQNNIKRFMAYSSISQAGYILMGFLSGTPEGLSAMAFYMLVYTLTNLAVFGVCIVHIHQSGKEDISSLRGLSITNPLLALALMIALFGLAGIPPLAGFVGKFFLFSIAAQIGYYWLVAVAAINSTISLYYYLRLIRQMYIEAPAPNTLCHAINPLSALGLGLATLGSVLVGLIPSIYEGIKNLSVHWL